MNNIAQQRFFGVAIIVALLICVSPLVTYAAKAADDRLCGLQGDWEKEWLKAARDTANYWHPSPWEYDANSSNRPPRLYLLTFGQAPVEVAKIAEYKAKMLTGEFDFDFSKLTMDGDYHQGSHTIVVGEGHHRFLAALDIAFETQNWQPFNQLVANGVWRRIDRIPPRAMRMPSHRTIIPLTRWSKLLNSLVPPQQVRN